ncbi:hypothetical protein Q8791_30515 [Nocardiopsis sp. CT-R113]|uniref:Uncharacterized protein n=1 Tax=Nocardiopsis codii TaxID=3065942 RepID=A0ABU7KI11_9ACTN|nr:hypothetical protein [Nocardiopsis sp. CT-R113]MEE2041564.1 hypothetical protein [Nocardiopsis sp. CT-R113]
MGKRGRRERGVDWSVTGGGPVSNTAVAALGLAAAAATGHGLAVSPVWGAAAGVAGAATNVMIGAAAEASPTGQVINIARWVGAGGWLTWCLSTTPWDVNSMLTLVVGSAISAGLAPLARGGRPAHTAQGGALVLNATSRTEREWEQRLGRIVHRTPFRVTRTVAWETGAGFTLHVDLPSGVTRKSLETHTDALAADARLPEGCGVELDKAESRGSVRLHVATVDRMRSSIDYPEDYSPRSIMDPIVLGEHRDSSPAQVMWREHSALFSGQRGSGKTTILNVGTAGVGRCTDALIWHIDLTGGGLSRAWLDPWLKGEVERPALDWAACTPADAHAMVTAALGIAKGRKASGFEKKMAADVSLLPIGADLPQIMLFADEGKTLLNPSSRGIIAKIRDGLEELQDIARDSAVNPVLSTLRATADTLNAGIKKGAVTRVAMAGSDDEELAYLLGWKRNLSVDDLAGPGTAYLTDGQEIRPMRGYNLTPRRVAEISRTISARRPELEQESRTAAGAAYLNRYERMRATFGVPGGAQTLTESGDVQDSESTQVAVPGEKPRLRSVPTAATWLREDPAPAQAAEPTPVGSDLGSWLTPTERTRTAPAGAEREAWDGVPDIISRALEVFDRLADDRVHSKELAEALGMTQQELAEALKRLGVESLPNKFVRRGSSLRGYERGALEAVAQRSREAASRPA